MVGHFEFLIQQQTYHWSILHGYHSISNLIDFFNLINTAH